MLVLALELPWCDTALVAVQHGLGMRDALLPVARSAALALGLAPALEEGGAGMRE